MPHKRTWRAALRERSSQLALLRSVLPPHWRTATPALPLHALVAHGLLLRAARASSAQMQRAISALWTLGPRIRYRDHPHALRGGVLGYEATALTQHVSCGDVLVSATLLRAEHASGRRDMVCATLALLAPHALGTSAGAWLELRLTLPVNDCEYPMAPYARVALGAAAPRPVPLPLRHGDVCPRTGELRHGMFPPELWSPAMTMQKFAMHVCSALGEPPACPTDDAADDDGDAFLDEATAALGAAAAARARTTAHGQLSLRAALLSPAALLGTDAAGVRRDWPDLMTVVAHDEELEPGELQLALQRTSSRACRPPKARGWAEVEAPARARLLRLLRWCRALCSLVRPAGDALPPSALERALAAELRCGVDASPEWAEPKANAAGERAISLPPAPPYHGQSKVPPGACVAVGADAQHAAERAWAADAGLPVPPSDAGGWQTTCAVALGLPSAPRLGASAAVAHAIEVSAPWDPDMQPHLRAQLLPMRRLALAQVAAWQAELPDARMAALDLLMLTWLRPDRAEAALAAAAAAAAAAQASRMPPPASLLAWMQLL